jgi:hypothetical protein
MNGEPRSASRLKYEAFHLPPDDPACATIGYTASPGINYCAVTHQGCPPAAEARGMWKWGWR